MVNRCARALLLYVSPFCVTIGSNDGVLPVWFQIPDWIMGILSKSQQSSCENALKCRLQMVDSLLWPQ